MASWLNKIFGSSSSESNAKDETKQDKSEIKKERTIPQFQFNNNPIVTVPETPKSIQHWEKEIDRIIPKDVVNRRVIEAAFNGTAFHKRLLGLAFLPFSKEHARTWFKKAADQNDLFSKNVLAELDQKHSEKYIMIWWSLRDFTNSLGTVTINTLNRATDVGLGKVVFRNAIIIPYLNDVTKNNWDSDYFNFIHDHIDSNVVGGSQILCIAFDKDDDKEDDVTDEDSEKFFTEDEIDEMYEDYNEEEDEECDDDDAFLERLFKDVENEADSKSKSSSTEEGQASVFKQKLKGL